jgi:hypothetical protein
LLSKEKILIIYDNVNVKKVKLKAIPSVTPRGFDLPPKDADEKTIGRSGQIQGAKIVSNPEKNAKKSKIIMVFL